MQHVGCLGRAVPGPRRGCGARGCKRCRVTSTLCRGAQGRQVTRLEVQFRRVMGTFPTGVTVVAVADGPDRIGGFTASSFVPLSLSPPLVLVCPQYGARTYALLRSTERFTVHILGEDQEDLARHFALVGAERSGLGEWRFDNRGYPVLEGALAVVQCRRYQEYDGGDHAIIVGEVEDAWVSSEDRNPLLYCRGSLLRFPLPGSNRASRANRAGGSASTPSKPT